MIMNVEHDRLIKENRINESIVVLKQNPELLNLFLKRTLDFPVQNLDFLKMLINRGANPQCTLGQQYSIFGYFKLRHDEGDLNENQEETYTYLCSVIRKQKIEGLNE